jgi:molybdopterin molybdotransferase
MPAPTPSLVLSFEEARLAVEQQAATLNPPATEIIDLLEAGNRVLAEAITADRDIPPFPRSTRDGYAVRSAGLNHAPAKLRIIGEIKAGAWQAQVEMHVGETFSIMTGAPVPKGSDAVVMIEYTEQQGEFVEIKKNVAPGENIVPQGAEAQRGSMLLNRGTRLNETAIALAASVGKSRLQVFQRPRVAILTTGDEIVGIDISPGPAQIRNSNSYSLAIQVQQAGGEAIILPSAPDEPRRLRELIEQGLESDLLLVTGGVSMGGYDLVEQVLAELQAEFFFTGAKIQPGRPVVFGQCGASALAREKRSPKYFFGLPGNPISTMVTFELFVRPMLDALSGASPRQLHFLHARLKSEVHVKPGLRRFLPAVISGQYETSQVELIAWHGSGDIAARSRSNCLLVIPPDREYIPAGEWVAVMPR